MPNRRLKHRSHAAILCLIAFACGYLPLATAASDTSNAAFQETRALQLLNGQTCATRVAQAEALPTPEPTASASPSPASTPGFPAIPNGPVQLYATPAPRSSPVTPPPIPTPTPTSTSAAGTVFLVRGAASPPVITPAGEPTASPTPIPTGAPTLQPGHIAVVSDSITGNTNSGIPGDAIGNVHVFYTSGELVGDRAHYDGIRTITVTGHPYLIDRQHDSIFYADVISFDTLDQTAHLENGRGVSDEGIDQGLVHFSTADLHTDPDGIGHGSQAYVTTCENPRGGYHVTGKTLAYYPGDRIIIYDAVLWLGAVAVFFLPRVVIPLRHVDSEAAKPGFFPELGYDQYEGAWIKTKLGFGKDKYYYGYYQVNYFTRVGLGLGYVGFYAARSGRRYANLNFYGIHDKRTLTTTYNVAASEQENISQTLRANFQANYQSNYGPLTNVPTNSSFAGQIVHATAHASQNYSYNHSAVGSQSSTDAFAFTAMNQITPSFSQSENFSLSRSQSDYGNFFSSNSTAHVTTLTHLVTRGADYQLIVDKTFAQQPYGIDKLPELQVHPYDFFQHFVFPMQASFTVGDYSQPSTSFSTSRADLAFVLGPALYQVFGSSFSASVNVNQFAYGTGDLKAAIQQTMSLSTPLGRHFVNAITYNEANYNGPAFLPFQFLDQQPTTNSKNAQDLLRFFNKDIYTLTLGFATNFNALAQPVTYQLAARPSRRSVLIIGGSFTPGSGQGFQQTNVQFATPFGYDTVLQFVGDINWTEKGRIENKNIYLSKIVGKCYVIQLQYNQAARQLSMTINLLAFPTQGAGFSVGQTGSLIPTSLNF